MKDKWVLFLGAGSDIAVAAAREFAKNGWSVQLASRNIVELEKEAQNLKIRYDVNAQVHAFDALDLESHEVFYRELDPSPDGVVLAFGTMEGDIKNITGVNYTGAVSILEIVAADMEKRKQGFIAGISSVAGDRGRAENYVYGSSKAGLNAYLSGLRQRLFKCGIHVMTVKPGFTATKMTAHMDLPARLTSSPEKVGLAIYRGIMKKRNIIYVSCLWKWIMMIIVHIPEFIFKRTRI